MAQHHLSSSSRETGAGRRPPPRQGAINAEGASSRRPLSGLTDGAVTDMAVSRLPTAALTLKQFLQRQRVLGIYRQMLRTIRQVPDEADRKYLRDWARDEFKRNKNATDQDTIRMMITQASNHLDELQKSLALARS